MLPWLPLRPCTASRYFQACRLNPGADPSLSPSPQPITGIPSALSLLGRCGCPRIMYDVLGLHVDSIPGNVEACDLGIEGTNERIEGGEPSACPRSGGAVRTGIRLTK
jgi:hypothetical protein